MAFLERLVRRRSSLGTCFRPGPFPLTLPSPRRGNQPERATVGLNVPQFHCRNTSRDAFRRVPIKIPVMELVLDQNQTRAGRRFTLSSGRGQGEGKFGLTRFPRVRSSEFTLRPRVGALVHIASGCLLTLAKSAARHRYQAAVVRYGRQRSPCFRICSGFGCFRLP